MMTLRNNIFNLGFWIYAFILTIVCTVLDKGAETLYCYAHYGKYYDTVFKWLTHLGEFFLIFPIAIYIILKKRDFFIYALGIYISQFLIVHILKRMLDFPRPLSFFKEIAFDLIQGIEPLYNHSMPSGHTALGFCTFFIISYLFPNRLVQILCLLLAIGVGFSRVFLLCHFKEDVLVGSLIGFLCSYVGTYLYKKNNLKISG